ncbi:MAG TPA: NAD(P)H-dependent oxidoreductase [Pseudonocardiaceae bacterium]
MVDIVLIGGSLRAGSVSADVLAACDALARERGAHTVMLPATELVLPLYEPDSDVRTPTARRFVDALETADAVVVVTPTYHGGMSGLLKNCFDYVEDLAHHRPAYLDGRAVGCAAVGWSESGASTAVAELRSTVLSLRGWPTPMGVTVNALEASVGDGVLAERRTYRRLSIMVDQLFQFTGAGRPGLDALASSG